MLNINKLIELEKKFVIIEEEINNPNFYRDQLKAKTILQENKELKHIVQKYRLFKEINKSILDTKTLLNDENNMDNDFNLIVEEEIYKLTLQKQNIENELSNLLSHKNKHDNKNVILEIRSGAGGEEAALFANSLLRMYTMFSENKNWKLEILNIKQTELGGLKEVSVLISGINVYSTFKFESGVHRVQRVPKTEAQGRVHTSTVTVAVLPEIKDIEIEINPSDIQIDTFRASGAGGQHVNKTESAIRITHISSNLVVECQDERSQHKNKEKAMKILRAKLYDLKNTEQKNSISLERKNQVGTGDRAERIRTYNYPENRVSDHRIKLTIYKLEAFMNGELDEIINELILYNKTQKMLS